VALPQVMGEFRVVADPTLRFAPSGMAICKLRAVASSRKKQDDGEWVDDKTCWVNLTGFKKAAENMAETFVKGDLVTVTGRVQTEDWEDSDGNKRTSVEVVVDSIGAAVTWTPAKIARTERGSSSQSSSSSSGGGASRSQSRDEVDPWATPAQDDAPPF
jgi:single-strand DNA-binding protein